MILQHFHICSLKLFAIVKIKFKLNILLSICLLLSINSFGQKKSADNNVLLVTTIKHLEKNINIADERIIRYENEIVKCDKTIATSEKLINLSRDQGNSEAEKVAKDALAKSKSAKDKNVKLLQAAYLLKKQSETNLASVNKELSSGSGNITALTLKYSGNISIQKNNGEQYRVSNSRGTVLENGDIISTSAGSKINLQFLEGRGDLLIGENSTLKFNKSDSIDIVDVIKGEVKFAVQKTEEFEKELKELYEDYKQKVENIPESYEQFIKRYQAKMKKKFEIRTSCGGGAVRGTELIVNHEENMYTEIVVIEGAVEMKSKDGLKTVMINAGQKGISDIDGNLTEPENIDLKTIEKWWIENE